jgi:hypothetical protein
LIPSYRKADMYKGDEKARVARIARQRAMPPARVAATYLMDTKTFALHFTHRHPESLGGAKELPQNLEYSVEQTYRAYHWRLHNATDPQGAEAVRNMQVPHYHDPDPPEAGIDRAIECLMEDRNWGWHEIAGIVGVVAAFPDGKLATRINGEVQHHQSIESATDRLVEATKVARDNIKKRNRKRS